MNTLIHKLGTLSLFAAYFFVMILCIVMDWIPLLVFPLGLLIVYVAIFHPEKAFVSIFFFFPLSFNIEGFSDTFGLFIPTEPILFGLMLLVIWRGLSMSSLERNELDVFLSKQLIIRSIALYLLVVFVLSIVSTSPIVSFKSLLSKMWYIIPIFTIGFKTFTNEKMIRWALWLFAIAMSLVTIYTVGIHSTYGFGEKESHWVMYPFFKDHTVYGATVAFATPILFGIYLSKKHDLLTSSVLIVMILINLTGLYFSYTRAAWLSVMGAIGVWGLIRYRVKISYLLTIGFLIGIIVAFNWSDISYMMSKNTTEHTTENFRDRLESATNVTTDASNLERINRWDCAIQMFQERPWTGFGPGTYAFEYAPFQRAKNKTIISTNFANGGNAHSEFLLALSEMGIFGLLSFMAVVASFFYTAIKLYYRVDNREMKAIVLSIILALTTYFIHSFLNNFLDQDKIAVPVYGTVAMLLAIVFNVSKSKKEPISHSS